MKILLWYIVANLVSAAVCYYVIWFKTNPAIREETRAGIRISFSTKEGIFKEVLTMCFLMIPYNLKGVYDSIVEKPTIVRRKIQL